MRPFGWRWFAVSSMLGLALAAGAETRPQYGGTLHVAMRAAPTSLDPADKSQPDSFDRRSLTLLMFDTLVTQDESGRARAALAESWQASAGGQRWQLRLRRGVRFDDGTLLTAEIAAASLRVANPSWNVAADGESIVIEEGTPDPDLPAELAFSRNAIVKRNADGKLSGSGPFHVVDWQPGKKLTLTAAENCWRGRPFLDGVEIEMGRNYRDQMMALESGRADLVEIAAEQSHRTLQGGHAVLSSPPVELLALVFSTDVRSADDKMLREALALSVERGSIRSVLLQGTGQPTGSILPNWMSGYGFVFPTEADLTKARHDREQVRNVPAWTLGYDGSDPLARLLADRIALNAKDAGLTLQPTAAGTANVQLARLPLASAAPWVALAEVTASIALPTVKSKSGSVEDLYAAEQAELATQRVIPLFHLPVSYAATVALKEWRLRPDGSWDLGNAWLGSAKP